MKYKVLVEQIYKILSGGHSEDSRYTHNEIFVRINQCIATIAKNSFYENAKIEGLNYANDAFNIKVSVDVDTEDGLSVLNLPQLPIVLPKNRGLVALYSTGVQYVPMLKKDEFIYKGAFDMPSSAMYYLLGNQIILLPATGTTLPSSVGVIMVSPANKNLEDEMPYSSDIISEIVVQVVSFLSAEKKSPQDIVGDGNDLN